MRFAQGCLDVKIIVVPSNLATKALDTAPPRSARRKWLIVVCLVAVALVVAGTSDYLLSGTLFCSGLVCGPVPSPEIVGGQVQVGSFGAQNCQVTSTDAVCSVFIMGGDSGTVSLGVSNTDCGKGDCASRADFLMYSSEPGYVNFTSVPSCAFASPPSLDSSGCLVNGTSTQTFRFAFTVASGYGNNRTRQADSITVAMDKTCCWP